MFSSRQLSEDSFLFDNELKGQKKCPLQLNRFNKVSQGETPGERVMNTKLQALILILMSALFAWGQGTTSRITGMVADKSGAVVSGATVTAVNEATNATYTTTSSATGVYVF